MNNHAAVPCDNVFTMIICNCCFFPCILVLNVQSVLKKGPNQCLDWPLVKNERLKLSVVPASFYRLMTKMNRKCLLSEKKHKVLSTTLLLRQRYKWHISYWTRLCFNEIATRMLHWELMFYQVWLSCHCHLGCMSIRHKVQLTQAYFRE